MINSSMKIIPSLNTSNDKSVCTSLHKPKMSLKIIYLLPYLLTKTMVMVCFKINEIRKYLLPTHNNAKSFLKEKLHIDKYIETSSTHNKSARLVLEHF